MIFVRLNATLWWALSSLDRLWFSYFWRWLGIWLSYRNREAPTPRHHCWLNQWTNKNSRYDSAAIFNVRKQWGKLKEIWHGPEETTP